MSVLRWVVFPVHAPADPAWHAVLDAQQRRHAATLGERQRVRYLNARIALRLTVAGLVQCDPQRVAIEQQASGQLRVCTQPPLFASVTYAQRLGLLVVGSSRLGLDYEDGVAPVFWRSAVRRYFCESERRWLQSRDEETREADFVWLWTRRESLLKYRGSGIRGDTRCLCRPEDAAPCQRSFNLAGGVGTLTGEVLTADLSPSRLALCGEWSPELDFSWRQAPGRMPCHVRSE